MSRVLCVYLAATIFACPLFCQLGQCGAAAEGVESICSGCCHGGGPISSEEQPSAPERDSSDEGGSCQCICGGAVVDGAAQSVAVLDTSWWSPVAIILPQIADSQQGQLDRFSGSPWPDDGMNAGRVLCCLYSTLLC
jgi:hypothetical protein